MSKVFSGHQPNFIPYLGFFYKMLRSDVFVLDDDVQYSNDGLHNANFLKIGGSRYKIVVPVNVKFGDRINEARICYERNWVDKMLKTIKMNYGKTPFFEEGYEFMSRHLNAGYELLSDMNIAMISEIAERLGLQTKIVIASKDVPTDRKNNERNVYQCVQLGADVYYSGVGGKAYNDEQMYADDGIKIVYSDFKPFVYRQTGKEFVDNLSIIDYVMNMGFTMPNEWKKLDMVDGRVTI